MITLNYLFMSFETVSYVFVFLLWTSVCWWSSVVYQQIFQ